VVDLPERNGSHTKQCPPASAGIRSSKSFFFLKEQAPGSALLIIYLIKKKEYKRV